MIFKTMFDMLKTAGSLPVVILEASVPVEVQKNPNLECWEPLASHFLQDCDDMAVGVSF